MTLFQNKYRIKSARKPDWNYAWPGWYFVTVCTKNRTCVLGKVTDGAVDLSRVGAYADACWRKIPHHYPKVEIDEFIVMPNHVHGIIVIKGPNPVFQRGVATPAKTLVGKEPEPGSLGNVVGSFKAAVSYGCGKQHPGFGWQPRFHDHVIGSEKSLGAIREYIRPNPANWQKDEFFMA
jgi:REP element-mobilizing transposase RayT